MCSIAEANATAIENGARYWEVVKDGKTERSPLTYNQIVSQMVCIFGDVQLERTPQKITFHFNAQVNFCFLILVFITFSCI